MKIAFNKNMICYLLVIALILSMGYAAKPRKERPQMKVIPDRFIVTHKTTGVLSTLTSAIGALDGKLDFNIDGPGISVYNSKNPNFAARARKIAGVVSVIPDFEMQWVDDDWSSDLKASATANDPPFAYNQNSYFNMQWGLDAINAIEAWQTGARGRGTLVAVLDTGFDLDHPDLQNNINTQKSRNFVPGETLQWGRRDSSFSHGTHVAAIIAGVDNNVGVIGVAPDAKLMLVKVLSDSGSGQFSWILQGIRHAVDQGADIINLSLGGFVDRVAAASYIDLFAQSMTYAYNRGVTVIAAAGNDAYDLDDQNNQGKINLPSQSPYVISVSSTTPIGWAKAPATANLDNFATSYSNYGSTVTFSAPGGDDLYPNTATDTATIAGITKPAYVFDLVFSAINNGWGWASGTSMAAPHVSGVAALIVRRNNRRLTPDQVKAKLQTSADDLGFPGQDVYYGLGRVNAYRAVTI